MSDKTEYLTLGQAAIKTGRSKSTIFKAIESGRLSYVEKTTAGYKLNPDEVFLVFPPNDLPAKQGKHTETIENVFLIRENELLREQINDLRSRLDDAENERRTILNLLTHSPEQHPEPAQKVESKLFDKLFGKDRR